MRRMLRLTDAEFTRLSERKAAPVAAPRQTAKYRNRRTTTQDGTFDSQGEAKRYQELTVLERGGLITGLQRQVKFRIGVLGILGPQHIDTYVADFVYFDIPNRSWVVEDFKGYRTDDFKRKKRLLREIYCLEILETKSPTI